MAGFIKVAHRGYSGAYPENTRIAFQKAIELGVDMIEMDCQLSKDGHVVVFHDERLRRTAGVPGLVKGKTLAQLKKLDVGAWFRKSWKGERILTLEEVMEIIAGNADLNLELKHVPHGPLGIELKVLFILSHYNYLERTIFSSFDISLLRRVRELAPGAQIGVLCRQGLKYNPLQLARELRAYSIQFQKCLVSPDLLEKAWEAEMKTFVWTVNEVTEMEKYLSLGVHGIISDYPNKFWKIKPRKK